VRAGGACKRRAQGEIVISTRRETVALSRNALNEKKPLRFAALRLFYMRAHPHGNYFCSAL
jgi:hypothetical protein